MEKQFQPYRKVNTFFRSSCDTPSSHYPQDETKKTLIELAEVQGNIPLQTRPLNLEGWNTTQQVESKQQESKQLPLFKKTLHLRSHYIARRRDGLSKDQNAKKKNSIIPNLKSLLTRLESPEKKRLNQKKFEEAEQYEPYVLPKNRKNSNSIRITNYSSQKKTRKVLAPRDRTELVLSKGNIKDLEEHLTLVREARRKRTLRNLLF